MTTTSQPEIDFAVLDVKYQGRVEAVSETWQADEDYAAFVAALKASTQPDGLISQNDVRLRLIEDTADGFRCSLPHHRYSGLWNRARKDGLIKVDGWDECTTSPTGNNGKQQRRYRAIGGTP